MHIWWCCIFRCSEKEKESFWVGIFLPHRNLRKQLHCLLLPFIFIPGRRWLDCINFAFNVRNFLTSTRIKVLISVDGILEEGWRILLLKNTSWIINHIFVQCLHVKFLFSVQDFWELHDSLIVRDQHHLVK